MKMAMTGRALLFSSPQLLAPKKGPAQGKTGKSAKPAPKVRCVKIIHCLLMQKIAIGKNAKSAVSSKKQKGSDMSKKEEMEEALAFIAPQQVYCSSSLTVFDVPDATQAQDQRC